MEEKRDLKPDSKSPVQRGDILVVHPLLPGHAAIALTHAFPVEKKKEGKTVTVWVAIVAHCVYPHCLISSKEINENVSVIRWKGDPKVIDYVIWFALEWIRAASNYDTSCYKAAFGYCFYHDQPLKDPATLGLKPLLDFYAAYKQRPTIPHLKEWIDQLERRYFCSQFVVIIWQAALLYEAKGNVQVVQSVLPLRAEKCTPNNIDEIPSFIPRFWTRITLDKKGGMEIEWPLKKYKPSPLVEKFSLWPLIDETKFDALVRKYFTAAKYVGRLFLEGSISLLSDLVKSPFTNPDLASQMAKSLAGE